MHPALIGVARTPLRFDIPQGLEGLSEVCGDQGLVDELGDPGNGLFVFDFELSLDCPSPLSLFMVSP